MGRKQVFLVLEPQALVQIDLTQAILEVRPDARVLAAASVDAAQPLLDGVERLAGAIVGVGVAPLKESGLARRIEALGAWIICLNGRHTDYILAEGWHPLARPFSSDDAQRLIRSLLATESCAPAAS